MNFSKYVLEQIAKELEMSACVTEANAEECEDLIINDLDNNGAPELSKCSYVLLRFMLDNAIINRIEIDSNVGRQPRKDIDPMLDSERVDDIMSNAPEGITSVPECYTMSDAGFPGCPKCWALKLCEDDRLLSLPPCYSFYYDVESVNCNNCMEDFSCKVGCEGGGM